MQIDVKFKRIDQSLPVPTYQTEGSVAFDLYSREDLEIPAGQIKLIPSNVCMQIPAGFALLVCARSSAPRKKGLSKPHGIGVIDQDYCGDQDEIMIQMYNFTSQVVQITKGERIAQGLIVPVVKAVLHEVSEMSNPDRGGFGSTDENIELTI